MFLTALWLIIIFIVNPIGDFPLNDDWAYAYTVQHLIDEGHFKLLNWGEMTLVAHVGVGYLFSLLFDFSFTTLRFSNLFISWIGIIGFYELCRTISYKKYFSLLLTLILIFNPVFLSLAFTYMTDTSYLTWITLSLLFFLKIDKRFNRMHLFLAILFCFIALMIRQLALTLPLAWMIYCILTKRSNKQFWVLTLSPMLVISLFYFSYQYFMNKWGLLAPRYNEKASLLFESIYNLDLNLIVNALGYLIISICYMGLFYLPLLFIAFKILPSKSLRAFILSSSLGITFLLAFFNKLIPSLNGVLVDFGVGLISLYGLNMNVSVSPPPNASFLFWIIITFIGCFIGLAFLTIIFLAIYNKNKSMYNNYHLFGIILTAVYLVPFLIVGVYDRYLICLFPFLAVALYPILKNIEWTKTRMIFPLFLCFCLGFFSILATHDYLSWNRSRWIAIDQILNVQEIPKEQFNGGIEYLTYYFFDEDLDEWWVKNSSEYQLSFIPDTNTIILKEYHYDRWLPGEGIFFLTQKQ